MSEDATTTGGVLEGLTPDEIAVLRRIMTRLEWQLLEAVVKRLKMMALVVAAVLTVFGIASLATIRSAIVEAAAEKLASGTDVRERVVADAGSKMNQVNEVVQKAKMYESELIAARGQALTAISADLDDALALISQIKTDLSTRETHDDDGTRTTTRK